MCVARHFPASLRLLRYISLGVKYIFSVPSLQVASVGSWVVRWMAVRYSREPAIHFVFIWPRPASLGRQSSAQKMIIQQPQQHDLDLIIFNIFFFLKKFQRISGQFFVIYLAICFFFKVPHFTACAGHMPDIPRPVGLLHLSAGQFIFISHNSPGARF